MRQKERDEYYSVFKTKVFFLKDIRVRYKHGYMLSALESLYGNDPMSYPWNADNVSPRNDGLRQ